MIGQADIGSHGPGSVPRGTVGMIFLWFVLSLGVFYSGHLYSNDTTTKVAVARSIVRRGSVAVTATRDVWGPRGTDGRTHPHFSLGSVLVMVPPVVVETVLAWLRSRTVPAYAISVLVTAQSLVYTALSGTLIVLLFLHWGLGRRRALLGGGATVFSSEMLVYSSVGYSEPAAFFWGLLGLYFLVGAGVRLSASTRWALWGLCAGVASLVRIEYVVFFTLFAGVELLRGASPRRSTAVGLGLLALMFLGHLWYNEIRYGGLLNFGYYTGGTVSEGSTAAAAETRHAILGWFRPSRFFRGFYRIFISWGKVHWFWAFPMTVLFPLVVASRDRVPPALKTAQIAALAYCFLFPGMGQNSWAWANRYMYTVLPYLVLGVAFVPATGRAGRAIVFVVITGFVISALGSLVNFHVTLERLVDLHGYHHAMSVSAENMIHAPVWEHARQFPYQLAETIKLAWGGAGGRPWEWLRVNCLDIWPVGLCAVGVWRGVAFGGWGLWTGGSIIAASRMMKACGRMRAKGGAFRAKF